MLILQSHCAHVAQKRSRLLIQTRGSIFLLYYSVSWCSFHSWFLLSETVETVLVDWLNLSSEHFTFGGRCGLVGAYERLLIATEMLDLAPWGYYPLRHLDIYKHACLCKGDAYGGQTWGGLATWAEQVLSRGSLTPCRTEWGKPMWPATPL